MQKVRVAVLFGGQSCEHEVSLISATSVIQNMYGHKYEMYFIGITKKGKWYLYNGDIDKIASGGWEEQARHIIFPPDPSYRGFFTADDPSTVYKVDIAFPVMHGPCGEDGTIQGVLELAGIPYVGCDVAASSAAMDKALSKSIFASCGLPQCEYRVVFKEEYENQPDELIKGIENSFTYPVFVKPANMGSSVGISKARNRHELKSAIEHAIKYDRKILVEEFIDGREIECAVLGNNNPKASVLGEIIPSNEFYDYHAKYQDGGKSGLIIPAKLPDDKTHQIRDMAVKAYRALDCSGLSRVDFFLERNTGEVFINEINTMPGFTQISMYPKLWEATGVSYPDLLDRLIELGIKRFKEKQGMKGDY